MWMRQAKALFHGLKYSREKRWQKYRTKALGLLAFLLVTVPGAMFANLINLFRKSKIIPMVGAAGISAFPMSAA